MRSRRNFNALQCQQTDRTMMRERERGREAEGGRGRDRGREKALRE